MASAPHQAPSPAGCPPEALAFASIATCTPGYDIPPFYDSLIGKLIVWAEDRPAALLRLRRALSECAVIGVPTTIDFHLSLLDRPEFQNAQVHTKFVEQEMLTD